MLEEIELSNMSVNPLGLLCIDLGESTMLDVGFTEILLTEKGPKVSSFGPNLFSIYESAEVMFTCLAANYGIYSDFSEFDKDIHTREYLLRLYRTLRPLD